MHYATNNPRARRRARSCPQEHESHLPAPETFVTSGPGAAHRDRPCSVEMTDYMSDEGSDLDPRRLWAGGVATAVVAALAAVAGILIARGIFGVAVLAPERDGLWGNASTGVYALFAASAALAATGLRHILSVTTPAPTQFFGWIMAICTVIAMVLPLTLGADLGSRVA